MSNTVDERVVRMQFDNTQFEQNVQTSLGTLDRLKQALNFDKTSKPLDGINEAIKNNNLPILGSAVDSVSSKFSALEVVAVTALANIANTVTNKLKATLDAVTIAPLRDGFEEYETQMNSVQTIMANTGKGVGEVNASLDVMNAYADKTIYNFQEMAANLGRFTAAGTELETSQQAIMGISNLAAVSGSRSQQASVAMYQLSQAIAAGSLKLQDWNSVVNAGMGGKVFQDALQRTAQHMLDANVQVKDASGNMISYRDAIGLTEGSIKDMIATEGSFRESLKNGWITTDVLTETLRQFQLNVETTEDYEKAVKQLVDSGYTQEEAKQIADMAKTAMDAATKVKTFSQLVDTTREALGSGWTKTWQIIFGDFEEAKELWTGVSNVLNGFIDKTSDARNNMLQTWKDLGGRTDLIESFKNIFAGLQTIVKPISDAFNDVFKPLTGETLANATKRLRELTEGFRLSDDAANKLKEAFHGVFSIIDAAKNVFGSLLRLVGPLFEVFKAFFEIFLDIASHIGTALTGLLESTSASEKFGSAIEFVSNILLRFAEIIRTSWARLKEFYRTIKERIDTPGLQSVWETVKGIGNAVGSLKDRVVNVIKSIKSSFDSSGFLGTLKTIWATLKKIGGGILNTLVNAVKQIAGAFGSGGGGIGKIINLLTVGGIGVAIKNLLELKKAFSFGDTLDSFKDALESIKGTLKAFQTEIQSKALLKIAIAVGILAVSLLVLSSIEPQKLNTGLKGLTAAIAELVAALAAVEKINANPKNMVANAVGMIMIAAAVAILAGAVKKLSDLSLEQIAKGLIGIGVLLKMISQFLNGTYFDNKGVISTAIGIVLLSAAIRILASSVAYLGNLDVGVLVKGLVAIGALLLELSIFTKIASGAKGMFSTGLALIFIAASMKIFASAMKDFGAMDWEEIKKGLAAMGGALLEVSIALNLIPKGAVGKGLGLVLVAASMLIVAKAFEKFGEMDWDVIKKSFVAMGGALLEMSVALRIVPKGAVGKALALVITAASLLLVAKAFQKFGAMDWEQIKKSLIAMGGALLEMSIAMRMMKGAIPGALAVMILSAALLMLTPVLVTLGNIKFSSIVKGLFALAGVFVVFAAGATILGPVVLVLLGVAGAIIAIAAGFALFGASLTVISAGIFALANAAMAVPAALDAIVKVLDGLIQQIVPKLGELLEAILAALVRALPSITATVILVVTNIIMILKAVVPMILQAVLDVLVQIVGMLAQYAPMLLQGVINIITGLLNTIAQNIPTIVQSIVSVFVSILQAIAQNAPTIIANIVAVIVAILQSIRDAIPQIVTVVAEIIVAFVNAVAENIPKIIDAAFNLIISFIEGLADAIDGNTDRLVAAVSHLISAIINAAVKLFTGVTGTFLKVGGNLIKSAAKGIKDHGPEVLSKVGDAIGKALKWIVKHFPDWLKAGADLLGKVVKGIGSVAGDILDKIGEILGDAKDAIIDKADDFVEAGKDLVRGLISGIGKKAGDLVDEARGVVSNAIDAAKNLLRINSPSKVFRDMGYSIDEGFIVGMRGMSDDVAKSSEFVAQGIVDAAKDPLDYLADLLSGDIIDNPTITPVMDLSEIQNGTNQLYSMMADADRYSLTGNISLANDASRSIARDQRRKQESENEMMGKLIGAINGLSALIGNTGNVYNVNGLTYDDGSNVSSAVRSLIHAAKIGGRA